MSSALLGLGLAFGVRHALEADHLASVAALCTRTTALRDAVGVAAAWGLGHGAVVLLAGASLRLLGVQLPQWMTPVLECAAGLVLLLLGLEVLYRSRPARPVAPALAVPVVPAPPAVPVLATGRPRLRALLVGSLHGLAGSSVLMVAMVPLLPGSPEALGYLGLFGLGGMVGMVLCTMVIYLPVRRAGRGAGMKVFQAMVGGLSVVVGVWVALSALRAGG